MYKIGICGHYGGNRKFLDGQTIKTKVITSELRKQFGAEQIQTLDTYGGIKKIFKQILQLFKLADECENVIILPAHNSLRVFAPILVFFNKIKKRKLHYIVIGGWLPEFLIKRRWLKNCLLKFTGIYVETMTMKSALEAQGFKNISILKNCKELQILKKDELKYTTEEPLKLCTFSRVTEKKGIEDIIWAVNKINIVAARKIFELDIYGQIDAEYKERFSEIQEKFPSFINYKGCVEFEKSVDVLKEYYALVFPTHFYTEGIPGTIIDAYAAGVPVISSMWESFGDVIKNNIVGIGYSFGSREELLKILQLVARDKNVLNRMKINCIDEAEKYLPSKAIHNLVELL